jgi:hypothetical protein
MNHREVLDAKARMRRILDDTKAANSHRDLLGTGKFVTPTVRVITSMDLRKHLVLDHGISPNVVGGLIGDSLAALHERQHSSRDVTS